MISTRDMAKSTRDVAKSTRDMAKSTRDVAIAFYVSPMPIKELDAIEKALQEYTRIYKILVQGEGSSKLPLALYK